MKRLVLLLIAAAFSIGVTNAQTDEHTGPGDHDRVKTTFNKIGIKDKDGTYQYGEEQNESNIDVLLEQKQVTFYGAKQTVVHITHTRWFHEIYEEDGHFWYMWDGYDDKDRTCQLRIDVYKSGLMHIIIIYDDIALLYASPPDDESKLSSYFKQN